MSVVTGGLPVQKCKLGMFGRPKTGSEAEATRLSALTGLSLVRRLDENTVILEGANAVRAIGAVADELRVGDLIVDENFSDPALLVNAERILSNRQPRRIKLFTSTSIIDSIAERNEIARSSGAAAVDMETGAIVAVCNAHRVPLLSLRAISDTPAHRLGGVAEGYR